MAFPPIIPTGQAQTTFSATVPPAVSGLGTRESRLSNFRPATNVRKMIHWLVPEGPVVQMYINPQNIVYGDKKIINPIRTKGGYTIQYWGEDLTTITLSGTTGSSSIEGINVLKDIYRNEQLQFDPFALFISAQNAQQNQTAGLFGADGPLGAGGGIVSSLLGAVTSSLPGGITQPPTLASMAFTVEMYWSGEVYRGFFTSFQVTEKADSIGLFDYNIGFTATSRRGMRTNSFAWNRSPVSGPSNSDPQFGTPYSYGSLSSGGGSAEPGLISSQTGISLDPFNIL